MGFDVIGMTNVAEARLAREAEIALATMAMITTRLLEVEDEPVTAKNGLRHLVSNAAAAREILPRVNRANPHDPRLAEHRSLDDALVTAKNLWPPETIEKLRQSRAVLCLIENP